VPDFVESLPQPATLDALFAVLGRVENESLEFKRQVAKLHDVIPAMAMTLGGVIVIGISDDRTLLGARLDQRTQDQITRAARDVGVEVKISEVAVEDSFVVTVVVPEVGERIVTTPDGRLLRRVGSDNRPLTGDALARFVLQRSKQAAEEDEIRADEDRFDLDLIRRALQAQGRPVQPALNPISALIDLGLAEPGGAVPGAKVMLAAGLMFGIDPRVWCAGAAVQLIRRVGVGPSAGPTRRREELAGPLPTLLTRCLDFITTNTETYEVVIGRQRVTLPEYPEVALREAILNALAHRDYSMSGTTVDITVWDDRVEIRSPGDLPAPITLQNMRDEHFSRNRRLMRSLKEFGLVEEFGEGVDRMFDEMGARLMDPPSITASATSVTVSFFNRFLVSVEDQAWLASLGHVELSEGERLALAIARRQTSVTRRSLKERLATGDPTQVLRGAVAKGLLTQTGARGGVRYVLSPELAMRTGASGVEAQSRKRQRLLDEILQRGSISTAEGVALLDEDPGVVRHLLADLALGGQVEARGNTRGRRYYAR